MIDLEEIQRARQRIGPHLLDTPIRPAPRFAKRTGIDLLFKLETLQLTGSFKVRGALNKILALDGAERQRGVIAASAGNHAQGVAFASSMLEIPATIVMPQTTPQIKIDNTRSYGERVDVILHGTSYDEAYQHARELQTLKQQTFIHPFDDDLVIAGQGTIGLELIEQVPDLEAVVIPIGGGGLISGIAVALRRLRPEVAIYGVQTEAAPAMHESLARGRRIEVPVSRSIAEGIRVRQPGERTFRYVERHVDHIALVSEAEIEVAISDLLEASKIVVEGAAAAGLAAVLRPLRERLEGRRTAVLLCGANIDLRLLHRIIERDLARTRRLVQLSSMVPDEPGALVRFLSIIAAQKGNVVRVIHDRVFASSRIDQADVVVTLEVLNQTHVTAIRQALEAGGYHVRLGPAEPPDNDDS